MITSINDLFIPSQFDELFQNCDSNYLLSNFKFSDEMLLTKFATAYYDQIVRTQPHITEATLEQMLINISKVNEKYPSICAATNSYYSNTTVTSTGINTYYIGKNNFESTITSLIYTIITSYDVSNELLFKIVSMNQSQTDILGIYVSKSKWFNEEKFLEFTKTYIKHNTVHYYTFAHIFRHKFFSVNFYTELQKYDKGLIHWPSVSSFDNTENITDNLIQTYSIFSKNISWVNVVNSVRDKQNVPETFWQLLELHQNNKSIKWNELSNSRMSNEFVDRFSHKLDLDTIVKCGRNSNSKLVQDYKLLNTIN